jgi:hypothetical protein
VDDESPQVDSSGELSVGEDVPPFDESVDDDVSPLDDSVLGVDVVALTGSPTFVASNQPHSDRLSFVNLVPWIVRSVKRHSVPSGPPPPSAVFHVPDGSSSMKTPVCPSFFFVDGGDAM